MSFKSGLLWQINSGSNPASYLFGTVHLQSPIYTDHLQLITEKLNPAVFWSGSGFRSNGIFGSSTFFKLPDSLNWSSYLRPGQWNKMQRISLQRFGIDLNQFTGMFPMIGLNQLSLQLIGRSLEKSLDQQLWELARQCDRHMIGLEDFDIHFNMIRSIDLQDQIKMIRELFNNLERSKRKYQK